MPVVPNPRIVYLGIPDALPVVGQHFKYDDTLSIDLDAVSLDGGFLVKNLVISPDPYLRGRMRDPSIPSYSEPLLPGDVCAPFIIGKV
jgi:NADPH-dependent curcumin reductase CurA